MANKTQENRASIWKERFENRKQKLNPMFEDAQKYYDIMYAVQNTSKISSLEVKSLRSDPSQQGLGSYR
jgi:hypothetical protein